MTESHSAESPFLQPLSFAAEEETSENKTTQLPERTKETDEVIVQCFFCQLTFNCSRTKDELLKHLVEEHKFVIGDVKLIADFKQYAEYWRGRFKEQRLEDFCSVINTNTKETDIGPKESYYLLCDLLPEDKQLRQKIQREKLVLVLEQQQRERDDTTFSRICLFCRELFHGNRSELFNHMNSEHNFNVGLPDNLVNTDEFLDLLQEKLDNLQCLYCEKNFKDRMTLKEHMRKKQHKRIKPQNPTYDKFYVINYLELGKNWENIQSEHDVAIEDDETDNEEEWTGWTDDTGARAVCLFCCHGDTDMDRLLEHMKVVHGFDLKTVRQAKRLNFYQQVKLINYIRRQMHQNCCILCCEKFEAREDLIGHYTHSGHVTQFPESSDWDQPQYFFPTFENDNLLCGLEDDREDDGNERGDDGIAADKDCNVVIAEDTQVPTESILKEGTVLQELIRS